MRLTDTKFKLAQSVLVYGPPKSGKTQLVSQLATKYNLTWFDLENGATTLLKLPQEAQERVNLIQLPDSRVYPIAIETCLKVIRGGACVIDDTTGKVVPKPLPGVDRTYTTVELNSLGPQDIVVFDSLTQLTNSAIANITKNQPDDYKLQFDDWNALGVLMDKFMSQVQAAKFNLVCISHETEAKLEDGTDKLVPVAGSRNFSRNVAKYFGHVVYCHISQKKHKFASATTAIMDVVAGSRTDVTVESMEAPSLIPIFEKALATNQSQGQKAVSQIATLAAKYRTAQGVK